MKAAMRKGGGGEGGSPAFVPPAEWLDTFLGQATGELVESAERYASYQAIKVGLVRHVDATYSEDLVQDILGDTLLGVIAWDPERVSLKKHLYDAIKSRTRHDYVHGAKFRALRIDIHRAVAREAEAVLAEQHETDAAVSQITSAVLDALCELAAGDREVQALLAAHRKLLTRKLDVMKLTGLSSKQYAAARKRMHRLTRKLPASLRDAAIGRE